jgi:hypothetical protein
VLVRGTGLEGKPIMVVLDDAEMVAEDKRDCRRLRYRRCELPVIVEAANERANV